MSSESPPLIGVLPVLPTPYRQDGAIDPKAMARLVQFAVGAGAHGIVFPGVASEFNFLSLDERRTLIGIVGANVGDLPFVVGASGNTVDEVVALSDEGRAAGATAAMVMAPASIGTEIPALVAFFSAIAERASLPIILQNAQPPVGSGLPIETILAVAKAVPQIAYIKEETLPSGPRISGLIAGAPASLKGVIGGGGARHLYDELERGAVAAMPALEIVDAHVALFGAYAGGDHAKARQIYIRTLPILLIQLIYRMTLTKETLVQRGLLDNALTRAPLPKFDERGLAEIGAILTELHDLLAAPLPASNT
ncbi:MAG TPA: dihydrodipicolinate synthase family protein [Devosiaceae bacterium]|jgi:4-hydroxy-tetrahydrodipicolinate synthase